MPSWPSQPGLPGSRSSSRVVEDGYGYSTRARGRQAAVEGQVRGDALIDGGFRTKTMSEDDLEGLGPEHDDGEYTWVGDRRGVKGAIRDVQYSAEGYYGNEASTTTFYASAALVITVPPADERDKTAPPPLTADRVHVAKVPSKPKPTPAWAKAKAKPTPKAKRPASGATPVVGRPAATTKRQRRATVDKAKSYAEPEVVSTEDEIRGRRRHQDQAQAQPVSACGRRGGLRGRGLRGGGAAPAADSDSDHFEMGATVPAPRAAPRAAPARVFARAASDVTGPRTIHVRGVRNNTRAPAGRQLGRHLTGGTRHCRAQENDTPDRRQVRSPHDGL